MYVEEDYRAQNYYSIQIFFTFSQHRRKSVYFEYDFLLSRDCIDRSPISTLLEGICCQIQTRGTYLWSDKQEHLSDQ
ncbi:hypothetical protein Plhal304r1_c031g0100351 [Plasmopara halstedii]